MKNEGDWRPNLPLWSNVMVEQGDPEIRWIERLQEQSIPISPVATAIRELITRFEICHFKAERHISKIIEAIGRMCLEVTPADIGKAHPRFGETAWHGDKSGRSQQGQEFIWALRMWLEDLAPQGSSRYVMPGLFSEVSRALRERNQKKELLVGALLNRLVLRVDRKPLPSELNSYWEPIERTDICHYAFPSNLRVILEAIGKLEPPVDFPGCGSCGEDQRGMAVKYFDALCAWLRQEPNELEMQLGNRIAVRKWLVASLAKTLKEQAGLREGVPIDETGVRSS